MLTRSGLEPIEAARALVMVSTITLGYARGVVLAGTDLHPQQQQIIQAIERSERTDLPSLESLAKAQFSLADETQLQFDLDVLLRGLESRLAPGGAATRIPAKQLGQVAGPCPQWDSNPYLGGFKPPASASWAMGAPA